MDKIATFELPKWIGDQKGHASLILSGSATPALSIRDLIELSSDRDKTTLNLSLGSLSLSLGSGNGSEPLRKAIAALYNEAITEDHVLTTNGATGANSLVFQSLLKPGDHVISLYPTYTQLLSMPEAITGVEVSLWKLSLDDQAAASFQSLEDMIRPTTRMIVLNNPNNPTGTILDADLHLKIVALARSRGIFVLVDEIFRPLFHNPKDGMPPSVVELSKEYTNVIVTGSLSKAWGLSGVRVGWLVTRNTEYLRECINLRLYTINSLSPIDEIIATEALSDRCRPQILLKHLAMAQQNLDLLETFIHQHQESCSWVRPSAGATAFVRFSHRGDIMDDVNFCLRLKAKTGVLLAPGSRCFGQRGNEDLHGFVRIHITAQPDVLRSALEAIDSFLQQM